MFKDNQVNPLTNGLMGNAPSSLMPTPYNPVVRGLWYSQKIIKLDGWVFEECRFDNCKLIIESPYFSIRNCYIDATNAIEVNGVLMNVVKFINLIPGQQSHPYYNAVKNPNGTITIGA
ncbi:hypothetical protein [Pseudomonas sp. B1(2018)]|uniref:hypothetical protein n=1 Tax=Pseudomonas sp. B1(2018) TaxID=2233856 RepID=UPI00105810D3|nr:hypothetical protein [Pseudomonas sp. B1(2018)]